MVRMVIVGAGIAGLSAALFAARRGHEVVLVERDAARPEGGADEVFASWRRPGVPQFRHSHKFLGRAVGVLLEEEPALVAELLAAGVRKTPVNRFDAGRGEPAEYALAARRPVFEAVLRRAVERRSGVELVLGRRVTGLRADRSGESVLVRGVELDDGRRLGSDLVVDASGRRSPVLRRMLRARLPPPETQHCGFVYLSRHYRLSPGRELPPMDRPLALHLGYAAALVFPGDNDTFSLSLTFATEDRLRHALRDPRVWDRFVAAVPHTARWAERGVPRGGVDGMSGIDNRWQRMPAADGPAIGGLVSIGDAAIQTNPTYGRGAAMAMMHAQHLARSAGEAEGDPAGYVAGFGAWTERHLGVWFRAQLAADRTGVARIEAGLRGARHEDTRDPFARLMAGMEAMASEDEVVGRGLGRMAHLLITPAQLLSDREVVRRVTRRLGETAVPEPRAQGPSRAEFESLVAC
ncbi:Dehydrogenase (flavoprotein) [Amycolatopsis rubida]|uniref:Dehydrogenase (Flavoprotein) n=2 Tax=Amycolatopsis rubida TaxID=112413 RepID=A0A1I5SC30_9PSEU|nr:Dehydrogenase (flavoprotein) [Amycolatopsis rubida]